MGECAGNAVLVHAHPLLMAPVPLQLGENGIAKFEDAAEVGALPALTTLYLEHNPVQRDYEYRLYFKRNYTSLTQLDATPLR